MSRGPNSFFLNSWNLLSILRYGTWAAKGLRATPPTACLRFYAILKSGIAAWLFAYTKVSLKTRHFQMSSFLRNIDDNPLIVRVPNFGGAHTQWQRYFVRNRSAFWLAWLVFGGIVTLHQHRCYFVLITFSTWAGYTRSAISCCIWQLLAVR